MKLMIFLSSFVERKSSDFAALFSFESVVRSCSYNFCNVISIVEFIGEFAEIIASGYWRFCGFLGIDDRICVHVQYSFFQDV